MAEVEEIDRRVRADIQGFGWHVALFPGDPKCPGWAHTIGLHASFGHPEILCFGSNLEFLHGLLNAVGARVRAGEQLPAGCEYSGLLSDYPVAVREVAACWFAPFLGNAAWHYRSHEFPALQCFWPDRAGRFPWHPDFAVDLRADQPLLFHTEVELALPAPMAETLRGEGAL